MGKSSKFIERTSLVRNYEETSFVELQSRRERLQHVLERRQQAAVTEAMTSTQTSTAVPETTTQATPEAIPDTKEPKKKKKSKKQKIPM